MNLILDDVVLILATGLIPLLRISALLLAAPLVSLKVVSVRIRVALAVVLTIFVYPTLDLPVIDPVSAAGLVLIIRELMVGLLFALVLQVVNAALVVAGQTLSMSMGLGMAQTVDPNSCLVSGGVVDPHIPLHWWSSDPDRADFDEFPGYAHRRPNLLC